ncbi:MAG: dihydroorotate dehydrogenase [Muribaculaceae bacterium]|nr:dihydroorotate dehydrogenase [Muribaculaceae bacterium]
MNLKVKIAPGLELRNPVITASGTFGYGPEYADFVDLSRLGGIIVKGTTLEPRQGNPYPRIAETPSGMLNAVGLQNPGVDAFVNMTYRIIRDIDTAVIVNISGSSPEDYAEVSRRLSGLDRIAAIEVNISCPNVKSGGMAFGTSTDGAAMVTKAVRENYDGPVIVKLSPNVTDIVSIAKAAEDAGADALSLTNTFLGMAVDVERMKPLLSTVTGGLSGPCIRPIAVRMVWQVAKAVQVPVIGLGGIMNGRDALEFIMAGATAIQVGTANFIDPAVSVRIVDEIREFCDRHGVADLSEIRGII